LSIFVVKVLPVRTTRCARSLVLLIVAVGIFVLA
jgi:hypothetical protein